MASSEGDMEVYDVVVKLIGPIDPVGETNTDNERYENLKAIAILIDKLLFDVDNVAVINMKQQEFSMKRAGHFAYDLLNEIRLVK